MKKKNKIILFSVLLIVVLILISFFSFRLINRYDNYIKHKDFFKQDNVHIESWMAVSVVKNKFNLSNQDLFEDYNIEDKFWYNRYTLDEICEKFNLDCEKYVEELNQKVKEKKND